MEGQIALVVGAGPGLGAALSRRFAKAGMRVAMASRNKEHIEKLAKETAEASGAEVRAHPCDVTDEGEVQALFADIRGAWGEPDLVAYNAGAFMPQSIMEAGLGDFERCWRVLCLGGFLVGRETAKAMAERGSGTILFTGATASLRGSAKFFNLAVGKFGLRALAQSMARELGPKGVHVAHIIIDGMILSEHYADLAAARLPDGLLEPDGIAETYYQIHLQQRSAWTLEIDLRPWVEKF